MECLKAYQNFPLVNDNVTISGHAERLSQKIRERYRNKPKTPINKSSSAQYSYHGSIATNEQTLTQPTTPVPRSIIRKGKINNNTNIQQWTQSPTVQQQQRTTTSTTNQVEAGTVMSNLSPDDSAKTMMTNVSRMVESLGTVVNTLAKENSNMAKATANTNETIKLMMLQQTETNKQMMIQQTTTMNNFMMLMTRNEERRQEVPIREIQPIRTTQQTSTPTSTITNSQYSQSQQSMSANKRKIDGIADDETTAVSTVIKGIENMAEEGEVIEMIDDQMEEMEEFTGEQTNDVTMEDNEQELNQQQQQITTSTTTNAIVAGDFSHQFKVRSTNTDKNIASAPGANRQ
jgi:hypothetical protein